MDLALVSSILRRLMPEVPVQVTTAGGTLNVARVAKFVADSGIAKHIIVLLDNDEAGKLASNEIIQLGLGDVAIVFAAPHLDKALSPQINDFFGSYERYREVKYSDRLAFIRGAIEAVNVDQLRAHETVQKILEAILHQPA